MSYVLSWFLVLTLLQGFFPGYTHLNVLSFKHVVSCRINVLSVACGMEHTLALCSDGVRLADLLFIDPFTPKKA